MLRRLGKEATKNHLDDAHASCAIGCKATRCCSFLCAWSTTTAAMITTPLITIRQNELTPIITRPSDRMPITNAPMIVPPDRPPAAYIDCR